MKILRESAPDFRQQLTSLAAASSLLDPEIEARTRAIVEAVQASGDKAVLDYTQRFDGVRLRADRLAITTAEVLTAAAKTGEHLRQALALAHRNISHFSRRALRRGWSTKNTQGGIVGEKFDPFDRVGIYVPGGTAPLVSTALATVTLAKVARCPEIVVCTPANREGSIDAALLHALRLAGATEIYRVGGAQAIAAMALGTPTIRRVQKVFGPGNTYVVAAKRLLFGRVAIDLLPGPSEVLVLADRTANPRYAAADLLAQAEHGSGYERVWLVTDSAKILRGVQREIERQLGDLPRRDFIQRALDRHGCLILVRNLASGVAVVNQIAPEHCEIMTRNGARLAERIRTAGAIFLGPYCPTVLGDYVAGPSHVLPTGGAGRLFAGLTVDQFQRRTSVVAYGRSALARSLAALETFGAVEGLSAHARSARVRFDASRGVPPRRRG